MPVIGKGGFAFAMKTVQKCLCGDPVADALRAIGRQPCVCSPSPNDFTEEERFLMFKHIMHNHVWPMAEAVTWQGRIAYSWTYSVRRWKHGGKRNFIGLVRKSAQMELAEADYSVWDLSPIHCLIGDDGHRFCRLLSAVDATEMEQRMNGMEADLAVIDRKLTSFQREKAAFGELRYRIALYDNTYEAVICGGKGGWLWQNLTW